MDLDALAARAARLFLGGAPDLVRIAHGMSATYRVTYGIGSGEASYVLRLHRPGFEGTDLKWDSVPRLESELTWVAALAADGTFGVQEPVPSTGGGYVEVVEGVPTTMLTWIDGEVLEGQPSEAQARAAGRLLARLHEHGRHWQQPATFDRPEHELGDARDALTRVRPKLAAEAFDVLDRTVEMAVGEVRSIPRTREHYGLIHGDLHDGNTLFVGDDPTPIDFGRCGHGYWLHDLAEGMLHLLPQGRRALVEGYGGLDAGAIRHTEAFFLLGAITGLGHQSARGDDIAGGVRQISQRLAPPFLAGQSFLIG